MLSSVMVVHMNVRCSWISIANCVHMRIGMQKHVRDIEKSLKNWVTNILNDILLAVLRSIASFILLIIMTRILGRKALSQMTFFDFAVVITFGSVAANIGIGQDNSFLTAITVLITIGLLGLLSGFLHIKSFRFRKLINSEPLVIIKDGAIIDVNMHRARVTINELNSMLRDKNIFNITDVHYAVLENSGSLSVLPKADRKPLTPKDMQIKPIEGGLTKDIIIDGIIMRENLSSTNLTETWLLDQLKQNTICNVKDVFYAGLAYNGSLYISKRSNQNIERHGQHGIE